MTPDDCGDAPKASLNRLVSGHRPPHSNTMFRFFRRCGLSAWFRTTFQSWPVRLQLIFTGQTERKMVLSFPARNEHGKIRYVAAALLCLPLIVPAGIGHTADAVIEQPPVAPIAAQPIVPQWTGPYIGAYGGYQWLDAMIDGAGGEKTHGLTGGGYAGYNYQLPSNLVLGIEGMGGWSGYEEEILGVSIEQGWEASLRGRMGYAFENSMIYGLAGLGAAGVEASVPGAEDSNVHLGWNLGAGFETMLTENISGRLEYNYTDYKEHEYSLGGVDTDIDLDSHAVKLGIGFKF
jgi:outer membrane immunogenic protein